MKQLSYLLLALAAVVCMPARADYVIDGAEYHVDTLVHRQVGPGTVNTIVRIPDYALNVYVMEVDLNDPNNRVETTMGYNTVGRTESLANAYTRNRTPVKRPFAGCNANFWVVSGSGAPLNQYALGSPLGGVARNDTVMVNDNNTCDQWDGGAKRTASAAMTRDKTVIVGRFLWSGEVASPKLPQALSFANINRRCVGGEMALWGPAYTRTREFEDNWTGYNTQGDNHTDNYYLTFAEGSDWKINAPMTLVVAGVVPNRDRMTLGDYDACLTATGAYKDAMAALAVGDTVTINQGWMVYEDDRPNDRPDIENLVTGNAPIMHNGELLGRNYDETYNSQVYSRTCYGASADGKHLYLLVIDRSTSPLYGKSDGCPTAVACQILKQMCPDMSEMVNMDAGGSAEMMLFGQIINTTTEGTPRAVDCGWLVEAVGEEDNEVASIAFDQFRIDMPAYSSVTPRVLGYNKIGELVDMDVQGFTLACDASIGTTRGQVFMAGGDVAGGVLTATLGDMTATVPVRIIEAHPSIALNPILIDTRDYPMEVTATINNNVYYYDPACIDWQVSDPAVAAIEGGVLRGVGEGTTDIGCQVGPYSEADQVTVEISPAEYLYQDWTGWTFKGAGAKDIAIDEATGTVSFAYASNRAPYLQMSKDLVLYSLPDTVGLVFNSTIPIDYVQIDARNRFNPSSNFLKIEPAGGAARFEPGVDHRILLDLDALGGADYVGTYPLTVKTIKFTISKADAVADDHTLALKSFYCHYPNHSGHVEPATGDVNIDGEVNIADINAIIDMILGGGAAAAGDVNRDGEVNISDINAVIDIILR